MKKETKKQHEHNFVVKHTEMGFERGWHWQRKIVNSLTFCKTCGEISDERMLKNHEEIKIEA